VISEDGVDMEIYEPLGGCLNGLWMMWRPNTRKELKGEAGSGGFGEYLPERGKKPKLDYGNFTICLPL